MLQKSEQSGGPAFPFSTVDGHVCLGMTLRDYFAAKALQGLLADPNAFTPDEGLGIAQTYARQAYDYADAMLEARE